MSRSLMIFLKAPRLGTVKTRLAESMGPRAALAAYQQMVGHLLGRLRTVPGVELRFAPDDAAGEVAGWRLPGWQAVGQGEGDLGERLARGFEQQFRAGRHRVLAIGADCPSVAVSHLEQGWAKLEEFDVVLGPATDGGYWLIGLRRPAAGLFRGIDWSTPVVLAQTLERVRNIGLTSCLLEEMSDIDTQADWETYLRGHENPKNLPHSC